MAGISPLDSFVAAADSGAHNATTQVSTPHTGLMIKRPTFQSLSTLLMVTMVACQGTHPDGPSHPDRRTSTPSSTPVRADEPDTTEATTPAIQPTVDASSTAQGIQLDLERPGYFEETTLAKAVDLFKQGKNHEAAKRLERFVSTHSDHPSTKAARFLALLARHDGGVYAPTAKRLAQLAKEWPAMADYAWFYAGSAYAFSDRHKEALEVLERVSDTSVLALRAAEKKARSLVALKQRPHAITVLKEALKQQPNQRQETWQQLADNQQAAGHQDDSQHSLRELASRFPGTRAGRLALRALGEAHELSGEQQLRLGRAHYQAHRHKLALSQLKSAAAQLPRASEPRCEALVLIARTHDKMKQGAKAWPWFRRALGCQGKWLADATFAGGRNRQRAKDWTKAQELLEAHIAQFGERTTADDASVMLAEIARGRGQDKEADRLLMAQLERWPDGDKADEAAWRLLWPHIDKRRWARALTVADALLEREVRERSYRAEGRTRYWRGRVLQELNRKDEALIAWERVLHEYPLSWYAVLAYARLLQESEERAESALSDALRSSEVPADPFAQLPTHILESDHLRHALILARMRLHESAERELTRITAPTEPEAKRAWTWLRIWLRHLMGKTSQATQLARGREPHFGATWPVGTQRRLWEMAHPRPFEEIITRWAGKRDIDPHWIWAIMREESSFNPKAVSWANAIGPMQIILPTGRTLARGTGIEATRENLQKPDIAVQLGSKFLARLLKRHPVVSLASAGYNAGGGAISKWRRRFGHLELDEFVERIPYREARGYAKRVTRSLARYHWLYGGQRMLRLPLTPIGAPPAR